MAVAGVGVGGDEQLVGDELRRAVQIDRHRRLVGGERHNALHPGVDGALDHIHGPEHVRLDALHGIVLGNRHVLHGRGMDHRVDPAHRALEPIPIAHVTDEKTEACVGKVARHFVLLELIAAVDDNALRIVLAQDPPHEGLPEGARTARHQE